MLELLFLLLAGHSLADTALQKDSQAKGKRRKREIDMSLVPKGQKPMNLWYMSLTHHSLIHGLVVMLITGKVVLGIIETISHWIIDFFKSEGYYSPKLDQTLHILCKLIYVILIKGEML